MPESRFFIPWLDQHPSIHIWLAGGTILFALGLALASLWRSRPEEKGRPDWIWAGVILGVLAAGRWPTFFINREFNPDESAHLAGAHRLIQDPVFWRSVDGGTSGPLNYFALWPAGWVCGWDSYWPARLTALVLLTIAFTLLHQSMSLLFGRGVARVAGLAAVGFEALTNSIDLQDYSTELLPMALVAGAFYAGVQRWARNGHPLWNALGGLLLGAVPLAKLQSVPLALCLGLGWLIAEFRAAGAPRRRIYLVAGALVPAALFAWQLTLAHLWDDFIFFYYRMNVNYNATGPLSLSGLLRTVLTISRENDSLLHLWLPGTLLWLVLLGRIGRPRFQTADRLAWAALAACLISFGSVISPHRPFLHYWHLLVLPVCFLLGAMIHQRLGPSAGPPRNRARWLAGAGLVALAGMLLVQRTLHPNTFVGYLMRYARPSRSELSERVMAHVRPDSSLAIWGWTTSVYAETGVAPVVRDSVFVNMLPLAPHWPEYRTRFLNDLAWAKPTLFIDSSGPCSQIYNSPRLAHDRVFPELGDYVRDHYVLVDEFSGARIYQRRDLTGGPPP